MTFLRRRQMAFAAILLLVFSAAASGVVMKAGVAKVDITPPPGSVGLWGRFDRLQPNRGAYDPLYARILVLEAGAQRMALVELDLGRTFGPNSLAQLRHAVRQSSGIGCVVAVATHTHAGPVIQDQYPSGTPPWERTALARIEQGIHEAQSRAEPVRLGTGYGVAYIGHNRRQLNGDGSITMLWNDPAQVLTEPMDPTVAVLRIDKADGAPLAILANYACHPVTFGSADLKFSADFPGVMCKVVNERMKAHPLCFYLQGAAGDVNVFDDGVAFQDGVLQRRDWAGNRLAKTVLRVATNIHTEVNPEPDLQFAVDNLPIHLRWNPEAFRAHMSMETGAKAVGLYLPPVQKIMEFPVTTVLINRQIAMMGMPGESFVQFQMSWRAQCPVRHCFFLGYTNGYDGYLPTLRAAAIGGYGAVNATTWAQVGAGELMLNHALVKVYQMLGQLRDGPRKDWKSER
ncbi:MAG: neutral/alkaline non-lysosomal ceramidase N-terminal domain-containing protein [Terriglobia bacterium]